ncbi:MAG: aldo/keto reductase [Mycobacteriaceae bacterium]|nr:aldo/keto reductase [Mycobacteriaceae bacterium]
MQTTTLGKSGLEVSRIAFGAWQLGGDWGRFEEDSAITAIRRALDLGINFFDTAQAYGFGASEHILGKALRPELLRARDHLVIATKGGLSRTDSGPTPDARPDSLRRGVDTSLTALGIDHIDLYQLHCPDPAVPVSETAGALADLVAEGKIAHVGVANYETGQIDEFSATLPVETLQPRYQVFCSDIGAELLPYCRAHDIGVLVYGSLAKGLLTGMLRSDTSFAARNWWSECRAFRTDADRRALEVVGELEYFAAHLGLTVSQLAIAWILARPGIHVAIVGARHISHLQDAVAAIDATLTDADLADVERIRNTGKPVAGPCTESA